jgi:DNA invertase Pin-like site-specific DNA recombinase
MSDKSIMFGYARVSAKDQNLNRQIDALMEFGVQGERIYSDTSSGKDFKRPAYRRLMKRLRPKDVVVVKSIDRLGRNYNEILEQWRLITKGKGASIVVLDMPLLDTREERDGITGVFLADLVLQLMSYVAQIERENIRQRQAEGIAAAKARGVKFGRPRIERPSNFEKVAREYKRGKITRVEAASLLGVCPATLSSWLKDGAGKS